MYLRVYMNIDTQILKEKVVQLAKMLQKDPHGHASDVLSEEVVSTVRRAVREATTQEELSEVALLNAELLQRLESHDPDGSLRFRDHLLSVDQVAEMAAKRRRSFPLETQRLNKEHVRVLTARLSEEWKKLSDSGELYSPVAEALSSEVCLAILRAVREATTQQELEEVSRFHAVLLDTYDPDREVKLENWIYSTDQIAELAEKRKRGIESVSREMGGMK